MRKLFTLLLAIFISSHLFAQDYLAAAKKDGKWGFIDEKGKFVIEPKYDNAKPFREGLAAVNEGYSFDPSNHSNCNTGKWGFIDAKGNMIIKPQFEEVKNFNEGLAKVNKGATYRNFGGVKLMGGKWGFINKTGQLVIEPNDTLYTSFSEGLCAFKVPKGSRWGYINQKNEVVIEDTYWKAGEFSQGIAPVMGNDYTFKYITKEGKQAFEKTYKKAYTFKEGYGFAKETSGLPVIIQEGGVYSFKIENLKDDDNLNLNFSEGLIKLPVQKNGAVKVGFAGKTGEWEVEPKYELADDFHEGLALVFYDRFYTFINRKGEIVIQLKDQIVENPENQVIFKAIPHPNVGHFSNGLCRVKLVDKWGYLNKKGKFEIEPQFEDVMDFTSVK